MNIGFIGCGNMATAIINGALTSRKYKPEEIAVFDIDAQKSRSFAEKAGVRTFGVIEELINFSQILVLAVKPQVLPGVLENCRLTVENKNPVIISIAAGKQLQTIKELLGYEAKVIRVMPNINAKVLQAISAICTNENVDSSEKNCAAELMSSCGQVIELSEDMFPLFGVLAGCAPAYSYMFIDALAKAAAENGFDYATALKIASQTVLGSAAAMLVSDTPAQTMIDSVCSPGGTTIEGVNSLLDDNFCSAVAKAFKASLDRDAALR